ncbi:MULTISPECIES: cation:proton antiporter [Bifidobacterium]|uniref:cation:proton antiporter domain-containing protein n=1 Tax=Bifidobacterium TaxID=1678 RepID=UPI0018DCD2A2|nr:cation:proton antiporter [Bifidobacterium asteroides]MBI0100260.1 cation:proton antiporter [Bifidobacterium sp. W8114]
METFILILCILAAVLVSSFISRFVPRISTPLVQIVLGAVMALLPIFPRMRLDPQLFMVLFIAPLLYYEAHTINKVELLKGLRSSLSLAIGLAALTMLMVGVILHAAWPMFPLAAAMALGAALGPTDAVAVSSLGESADLTPDEHSILAGESLFNDATGVIGFQFAILATVTGSFSLPQALGEFFVEFVGGIGFGLIMGFVINWLFESARRLGWETTTTRILLELFLPFLIYMVGQNILHVSGILAVVSTGLLIRFDHTGVGPNTSKANIVSSSVWKVLSFSLNGAVFVLLGMLLPAAMGTSWRDRRVSNWMLVATITVVCLTVIVLRFLWTASVLIFTKDHETGSRPRITSKLLRSAAVMTFGGPKGTITLSLALTIPYMTDDGSAFPMRSELIFVAAGVIIVTLVLANFALPLLAPSQSSEVPAQQVEKSIKVLRGTVRELSSRITDENRLAIQQVIKQYNHRIAKLKSQIGQYSPKDFQDLQVQTMEWEQDYMEERLSRIEEAQDQLEEQPRSEDGGIEQAPASRQSAAGTETGTQPSTEAETVADRDADAQLIDRRSERGDDQDELLNLRSQEQAARRILSTISGSLFHLDRGGELRWRAYTARRRIRGLLHSQFHRLKHLTQPIDKDQVYVAGRHLQAEMNHFLIEKLYSELGKGRFKTEDLLTTIINHQMIESSAEGKTEYAGIPAVRDQVEEAKREGYAIELSQIQDMVESGEISRTTARKMRRNVYVMQVDADSAL